MSSIAQLIATAIEGDVAAISDKMTPAQIAALAETLAEKAQEVLKVEPKKTSKMVRTRAVPDDEDRCCGMVWNSGEGGRCSRKRIADHPEFSQYCTKCVRECGTYGGIPKHGVFNRETGLMEPRVTFTATDAPGKLFIMEWNIDTDAMKEKIAEAKAAGAVPQRATGATGGRKPRKAKKVRDPSKPKRAMNAYMRYAQERRAAIRADQPELSMAEISKLIGDEWASLSDEEKKPYVEAYEAEKAERDAAIAAAAPAKEEGEDEEGDSKKGKRTRRMPTEKAKDLEIGAERIGEDGNTYEVYETPKGRKGWRKVEGAKAEAKEEPETAAAPAPMKVSPPPVPVAAPAKEEAEEADEDDEEVEIYRHNKSGKVYALSGNQLQMLEVDDDGDVVGTTDVVRPITDFKKGLLEFTKIEQEDDDEE